MLEQEDFCYTNKFTKLKQFTLHVSIPIPKQFTVCCDYLSSKDRQLIQFATLYIGLNLNKKL